MPSHPRYHPARYRNRTRRSPRLSTPIRNIKHEKRLRRQSRQSRLIPHITPQHSLTRYSNQKKRNILASQLVIVRLTS
jgi:hypothetical protein